ncbi:VOC family protein [Paucibacter sp. M5-1]|uniref:VOC family protein n=1 Tax=Paucibacter sp. M5-1 TaxID=3015998 RepID=UPI0022B93E4E|nr:VOC family protein [Paucibacter sp. M5-1]MCZ7883559.1 glyoxalase [Paucibacter sp. M5-1]
MVAALVHHVQLPMPPGGARVARRFYESLLGLREHRDPALDRPGVLRFALGGARLDLSEGLYSGVAPQAHLALTVQDLAPLLRRLQAAEHPVDRSLLSEGRAYTEDPFGNRLELIEAPAETSPFVLRDHHVTELKLAL